MGLSEILLGRGMPLLDVTNEMGSLDGTSTLVKLQTESEASRLWAIGLWWSLLWFLGGNIIGLLKNICSNYTPLYNPGEALIIAIKGKLSLSSLQLKEDFHCRTIWEIFFILVAHEIHGHIKIIWPFISLI